MPLRHVRALAATLVASSVVLLLAGACAESVAPETWLLSSEAIPATPIVGKVAAPSPAVRVTVNGAARAGASVTWSATAGTLSSTSSLSDAAGRATTEWTLGTTAGTQTLTATGPSGTTPVQFTLTVAPDRPAIVKFTPDSVVLDAVGDSVKLTPVVTDQYQNATTVTPTFAVDSATIAGLTSGGYAKSVKNGRATVTATADTAHGKFTVVVRQAVATIELTPNAPGTLTSLGDTLRVQAAAKDRLGATVPDAKPLYASSDTSVVSVDTLGKVTARKNGSAYVKASVAGSAARDSSQVTVQQVPASIALTLATAQIAAGDSAQVTAVVKDARGAAIVGAPVTYTSSVDTVAEVTAAGYVRAKVLGSVTITATSGAATATVNASVIAGAPATVTLSATPTTLASLGATTTVSAQVRDARGNPVSATVTWSSSSAAATVSASGVVTAAANGSAWIRATAGAAKDSIQVTVQQVVSSVTLALDSLALAVGDSSALSVTAKDAGGTAVTGATFTWTSRDTTIAKVSSSGTVTARGAGLVRVVATSGSAMDSLQVRAYFTDPGCVSATFAVGDTLNGAWAVNDCVTGASVPYDRYVLTVASQAHFRATVDGPAGRKLLMRQGSVTGPYIAFMPRAIADTMNPIAIDYLLQPGTYVLEVHAPAAAAYANYQLRTSAVSSISCDALTWATPNVQVSGSLASGDCLFNSIYNDYLVVQVPTGTRLRATLTSSGFRPVIGIKDDHSLDAEILSRSIRNVPGTVVTSWTTTFDDAGHNLIVSTYAAGETGTYTLALDAVDASNTCGVQTVDNGMEVDARWEVTDCKDSTGNAYDAFQPATPVQALRMSTVGPANRYLQVIVDGQSVGRHIRPDTTLYSSHWFLRPGAAQIRIGAPNGGGAVDYGINFRSDTNITNCRYTWAQRGAAIPGQKLEATDCTYEGRYQDRLLVRLDSGATFSPTMTSAFAPRIVIRDANTAPDQYLLIVQDSVPGSLTATWTPTFRGVYEIIFSSYVAGATGNYRLTLPLRAAAIAASPDSVSLVAGDTVTAAASVTDTEGNAWSGVPAWVSRDTTIARVSATGTITAVAPGATRIVATADAASDSVLVTVTAVAAPVATAQVSPDTLAIAVSDTASFAVTLRDAGGNVLGGRAVSWTSADTSIATVSAAGLVAARAVGGVWVTATSEGISDSGWVAVSPVAVATVVIAPDSANVVVGDTVRLRATLLSAQGDTIAGRSIAWSSSDTTLATVDSLGLVTARAVGRPVITAEREGVTDTVKVAIAAAPVASAQVAPDTLQLVVNDTASFAVTLRDAASNVLTGRAVTWTSADTAVATVSGSGLVTAKAAGAVWVTATSEGVSDSGYVAVSTLAVATVAIAPDSANIVVGDTVRLRATLLSAQGDTITGRAIAWTSSDTSLATVDSLGLVTALAVGRPVITAEREGVTDTVTVAITPAPVASVTLAPDTLRLNVADTASFAATLRDARDTVLTGRAVAWTSANATIAVVSASGQVTGRGVGTVWVTATSEGVSDSATVVVSPMPVATVHLVPASTGGYIGAATPLQVVTLGANGDTLTGRAVTWTSLNPSLATVDTTGTVTGVAAGLARIVATSEGKADTAKVLVRSPVTRIVIAPDSTTLTSIGATQMLTAVAYDTADVAMTGVTFSWSVANPLVASLSATSGENVTATSEGAGVTQVFASALGQTGSGVVRVGQFAATINASPDTVYVTVGGRATLTADVRDAGNAQISGAQPVWRKSNSVFSLDTLTGAVTGSSLGNGFAWAELDGVTSDSVYVVVTSSAPPAIAFGSRTFAVGKASSVQVPIYLSTAPTSNVVVRLTSSDTAKAKFSSPTVTFGPGSTQQNVSLYGQATGNVTLSATDSAAVFAGDTVTAQVQIAVQLLFGRLSANGSSMNVQDTFPGQLKLSDPAPAGGLYFTIDGKGYVEPSQPTLYVPAGNLAADFTIAGKAPGSSFTITASANGTTVGGFPMNQVYPRALTFTNNSMTGGTNHRVLVARGLELLPWSSGIGATVGTPAKVSSAVAVTIGSSDSAVAVPLSQSAVRIGPDSNAYRIGVRGLSLGTSILTASAAGWASTVDTVIVTSPRFWAQVGLDTAGLYPNSPAVGLSVWIADSLRNAGGSAIDTVFFTLRSSDTTVVKFAQYSGFIAKGNFNTSAPGVLAEGVGTAWVYVEAPGILADSFKVNVRQAQLTFGGNTIGSVGMSTPGGYSLAIPGTRRSPTVVTLTSSDSSIVAVDSTLTIPVSSSYVGMGMRSHGYGTVTIVASAPGYLPDTITVSTASPRLFVYSYPTRVFGNLADTLKLPAFGDRDIAFTIMDSVRSNTGVTPLDNIPVSFSVDDTTIATIDSAQVTRGPSIYTNPGRIRAVGGGMTWLRVTSPGVLPDSFRIVVEAAPLTSSIGSSSRLAPYQHSAGGSYDPYVYIPNARTSPVVVHLTHLNPSVATTDADSVVIAAGQTYGQIGWAGHAIGSDTVIVSATGYAPDTVVFLVEQGRLRHYMGGGQRNSFYTTSSPTPRAFGLQTVNTTSNAPSTRTEVIRIVSTDPTVIMPDSEYVHVPAGTKDPFYNFSIVGPGTAKFVITDSLGEYVGDTSVAVTVTAPPINFANYGYTIGMNQQTPIVSGNPQEWVYVQDTVKGAPRVIYLASSDTTVASVPDSVIIPVGQVGAWFTVTSHDTTGVIAITANSTGHLQGRYDLTVTRGMIDAFTSGIQVGNAAPTTTYIYLRDSLNLYRSYRSTEPVVLTLTSSNPGVVRVDSTTITVPAGVSDFTIQDAWRPVSAGTATLTLKDERTGFVYYIQKSFNVTVSP